ncbi:hypothetical protein [Almyronema epifaneia]|uniref:TonB C-terminal domain-containing protein n=1 Tax=Almyronema epifaneia S1 TaxID=2991925 RepID=A0ABW6IJY6_9CYAN
MLPPDKPNPWTRSLIGWMPLGFLVALGLHAFVLFVPLSSSQEIPRPEATAEETVTISRLPPPTAPTEAATASEAKPAEQFARPSAAQSGTQRSAQPSARVTRPNSSPRPAASRRRQSTQTATESESQRSVEAEISALPADADARTTPAADGRTRSLTPSASETTDNAQPLAGLLAYAKTLAAQPMIASEALISYIDYLSRAYTYNPRNTTPAEATANLAAWTAQLSATAATADLAPPISSQVTLAYPLKVCLHEAPQSAKVGALVAANGNLIDLPVLLKSTGYEGLNEKAIAAIQAQSFEQTERSQTYVYDVTIDYDAARCFQPAKADDRADSTAARALLN